MAYRSVATAVGVATVTVTKPAGTVDGDILIAGAVGGGASASAVTAPAGWTQWGSDLAVGTTHGAFFWKRAASEGANYVFTSTGAAATEGQIVCVSGRIPTGDPNDGLTTAVSASGTSHAVTGFTTTRADDFVTMFVSLVGVVTFTPPTNFTERADANNCEANSWDAVAQGATGNPTATSSGTTQCGMLFAALKPDPAALVGAYFGKGSNPGLTPSTMSRFYAPVTKGFTPTATTTLFRKTLSGLGSRTGGRQTHNT